MTRSGSSHSGGSRGMTHQHEQLMRQQQQQAMLNAQQNQSNGVILIWLDVISTGSTKLPL